MICIEDKYKCCGCGACAQRCPQKCIYMVEDFEGFLYPKVNKEFCNNCGLCEKVCPFINITKGSDSVSCLALKNPNDYIRQKSSSGGIFYLLSEYILKQGGVVFGATYDEDWNIVHSYTDKIENIHQFMGSKYVQSKIGDTYIQAERFLKLGVQVLFSGTPCQIAGLRKYLIKEYHNLLLVDVVCHGVPSPKVWSTYLDYVTNGNKDNISDINFRDKTTGWKLYRLKISGKKKDNGSDIIFCNDIYNKNLFLSLFRNNIGIRHSCSQCKVKGGASKSDITLGDLWCIAKTNIIDDDKGYSSAIINTIKANNIIRSLTLDMVEIDYSVLIDSNPAICKGFEESRWNSEFWTKFLESGMTQISYFLKRVEPSRLEQYFIQIGIIIKNIINKHQGK